MTSFVETDSGTVAEEKVSHSNSYNTYQKDFRRRHRHVLKSKENYCKLKCIKLLKKKLKKYKLRHDGLEDQDVLDVSKTLVSSLSIRSPNKHNNNLIEESELEYLHELRPRNYLFKMVRRKESVKTGNENNDTPETMSKQKKHTNAFQLLMDSRNKSIGSNSPGKERSDDQCDSEDMIEKKNIKVKRKVLLEKMAEAKGYRKNKEIEEYQDKIIKKKMEKRAERLKIMILKETKPAKSNLKLTTNKEVENTKFNTKDEAKINDNNQEKKKKSFTIVDIFNTLSDQVYVSPEKKYIPQEDKEFLKKLSPSLRKKESLLSYFKKVDRESEASQADSDNDNLLKVKIQMKRKKKVKKKKISLKRETNQLDDVASVNDENKSILPKTVTPVSEVINSCAENIESKSERQKRKRNDKIEKINTSVDNVLNNDSRPKRSIKRPIKYTDDVYISSSDEDLHIFTPKKKKIGRDTNHKLTINNKDHVVTENKVTIDKNKGNIVSAENNAVEKKHVEEKTTAKKTVKLAPIFASKAVDTAALEAKQKFLQSGVPDKLKKIIQQQKTLDAVRSEFPVIVHVQQMDSSLPKPAPTLQFISDNLDKTSDEDNLLPLSNIEKYAYNKLLNLQEVSQKACIDTNFSKNIQELLQIIKQKHPKFPVYRTYRYLQGKRKGELHDCSSDFNNSVEILNEEIDIISNSPDKLNWTNKYKALSTDKIIGNFESVKELRKWLVAWSENESKPNSKGQSQSDSSDYYQSDPDSRDSLKATNNLLIITGPTGCGKTSSVYAVAAELAIKVIEVNASSKRTGKIMLQDLQEATQSHKVNRATSFTDSQKSQERNDKNLTELLKKNKKKGRPKKSIEKSKKSTEDSVTLSTTPSSQESVRTAMSLILVDDADIVFDQDDGFTSAIVQLVQSSKRPVILITSSLMCPHLQRFFMNGKILKMSPLLPRLVGTWLDILCLVDTGFSWPGLGANLLNYFNGDIRKTINFLQFYVSSSAYRSISNEDSASQDIDYHKTNIDDETSNMSWPDSENSEEKKLMPIDNKNFDASSNAMWTDFVGGHLNISRFRYPTELFDIWWSVPHLLGTMPSEQTNIVVLPNSSVVKELDAVANLIDAMSLSDYVTHSRPETKSDTTWPWHSYVSDSVSEQDNIDYYRNNSMVGDEICHTLVTGYLAEAQEVLSCVRKTDIQFRGMYFQRERDKVVTRHKNLTSYLSPSSSLDRRSLALDYWSSCRTICRIEKSKTDTQVNLKRNNRFCHYLKSLSILCKSETFNNLCDSLPCQGTVLKLSHFNE